MSDPFIGEIRVFAFDYAPVDWALCNGQQLQVAQNPALFSILGSAYGGNGQTTFNLPDIRSRVVMGPASGQSQVGVTQGGNGVVLNLGQIPQHSHTLYGDVGHATSNSPEAQYPVRLQDAGDNAYVPVAQSAALTALSPSAVGVYGVASPQPHENRQPFLVMNYCICLQGIYPVRPS